jgi:Caspase domain
MFKRLSMMTLLLTLAPVWPADAQEHPRLALLIGNQGYTQKVGPLKNPFNDVGLIETSLKLLGFKVTLLKDANYKAMNSAVKRYVTEVRRAGPGAISFFYYSGHGVANPETQINYLIPIDVADADNDKVWFESLQQNTIINLLSKQAPNATHYVVFDACRNELRLSGPSAKALGAQKGFVPVIDNSGLLIAYATAPRETASDAGVGGGPYAKALAEELLKPGIEAVSMFRNVQIRVKQTNGQDPWLSFPSLPPVYLAGNPDAAASWPTAPPGLQAYLSEAAEAWDRTKDSTNIAVLEAFMSRYKNTYYAELARAQFEVAKKQQSALAREPGAPSEVSRSEPRGVASSQFDGSWRVEWSNNEHCKRKTLTTSWTVTNGVLVTGQGDRGTVDSEGQLRIKYPCPLHPANTCSVRARLHGDQGAGNFFGFGSCAGRVTLIHM